MFKQCINNLILLCNVVNPSTCVSVIVATVGFLMFCNTLDLGFSFDDKNAIENNQDLLPNAPWLNLLQNDYWGTPMSSPNSHKLYCPLTVATFKMNYYEDELLKPLLHHLVNVLLHSAVCVLYAQLCCEVFYEGFQALIAALLFAVHPIHTEAVSI